MSSNRTVLCCAAAGVLSGACGVARAGDIFTDRGAYEAAVLGLGLSPAWSEDFEGFPIGPVPAPTTIGGGMAEIAISGGSALVIDGTPFGTGNGWLGDPGGFGETIQGLGGGSLGVSAIGFDYFSEMPGGYNFNHSGGIDSAAMGPPLVPMFVGWIGDPGEVLDFVDYTPGTSSHILDNIVASVPAPGSAALFGLAGLAAARRRR